MMTRCFCLSPQSAIFLMVGLSLIPRFLSPYGLKAGTIYILLFWLPFLVILPEIIKEAPIGDGYKTVDYAKVVPLLVEAIKDLSKELDEVKKQLNHN